MIDQLTDWHTNWLIDSLIFLVLDFTSLSNCSTRWKVFNSPSICHSHSFGTLNDDHLLLFIIFLLLPVLNKYFSTLIQVMVNKKQRLYNHVTFSFQGLYAMSMNLMDSAVAQFNVAFEVCTLYVQGFLNVSWHSPLKTQFFIFETFENQVLGLEFPVWIFQKLSFEELFKLQDFDDQL